MIRIAVELFNFLTVQFYFHVLCIKNIDRHKNIKCKLNEK